MTNTGGSYKCSTCANEWDGLPKEPQFQCTTCVESKGEKFSKPTNKCGCQEDQGYQLVGGVCLKIDNDDRVDDPSFMYRSIRQTGRAESTRQSAVLSPVVFQNYFQKAHFLCAGHKVLQ